MLDHKFRWEKKVTMCKKSYRRRKGKEIMKTVFWWLKGWANLWGNQMHKIWHKKEVWQSTGKSICSHGQATRPTVWDRRHAKTVSWLAKKRWRKEQGPDRRILRRRHWPPQRHQSVAKTWSSACGWTNRIESYRQAAKIVRRWLWAQGELEAMKQYLAWVRKVGAVKWWLIGIPVRWLSLLFLYQVWPASAFFFILTI